MKEKRKKYTSVVIAGLLVQLDACTYLTHSIFINDPNIQNQLKYQLLYNYSSINYKIFIA